jgi:hypothetical protein
MTTLPYIQHITHNAGAQQLTSSQNTFPIK